MEDWFSGKLGKWALKEALALIFVMATALAKVVPIFDDGNYKADAVLYMIIFGLLYFAWDLAR